MAGGASARRMIPTWGVAEAVYATRETVARVWVTDAPQSPGGDSCGGGPIPEG